MKSLRKRPTYNEIVDYLENDQPKIKYPDRTATFLRNSPYLSQFDGDFSFINLEEQENNITKEKMKEELIKSLAASAHQTAQLIRSENQSRTSSRFTTPASYYDSDLIIDATDDYPEVVMDYELLKQEEDRLQKENLERLDKNCY